MYSYKDINPSKFWIWEEYVCIPSESRETPSNRKLLSVYCWLLLLTLRHCNCMIGLRQAAPAERLSCQTLHTSTYMLCTPFNMLAVPPSELSLTNVTLNKQCILRHRLMVHSTTGDKGVKQPLKNYKIWDPVSWYTVPWEIRGGKQPLKNDNRHGTPYHRR